MPEMYHHGDRDQILLSFENSNLGRLIEVIPEGQKTQANSFGEYETLGRKIASHRGEA